MGIELFDILTFDHIHVLDVEVTAEDPDWQELVRLTTPNRATGLYLVKLELIFTISTTSSSAMYRFSLDGGSTWSDTFMEEVQDRTNVTVTDMNAIEGHPGGPIDIIIQAAKESASPTFTAKKAKIIVERKG